MGKKMQSSINDISSRIGAIDHKKKCTSDSDISKVIQANGDPHEYLESLLENLNASEVSRVVSKGDDFHKNVLSLLMDKFNFRSMPIDIALRIFLFNFSLPVEGQQIERVISAFAAKYHTHNPSLFKDSDSVHIVSVALVMLNTDLHNPHQKRKMSREEFCKNTRRALQDIAIPEIYFQVIFDNIKGDAFSYHSERNEGRWKINRPPEIGDLAASSSELVSRIFSEYPIVSNDSTMFGKIHTQTAKQLVSTQDPKGALGLILSKMSWEGVSSICFIFL